MKKILLPLVWILAILGAIKLVDSFNRKSEHFLGIADNREQNISFENPVEIIQTLAVEGQDVQQGTPILEVKQHDLVSSQATLDEKIRKLELEKNEATNTITSQIESLKAKKESSLAEINNQIHEVEAQMLILQRNRMLAESISNTVIEPVSTSVEAMQIADLKKQSHYTAQAIQAEINNLTQQLNAKSRPVDAQIAELKASRAELQRQNKNLKVSAQFNGRIGSINFKAGDLVAAFQPIMSVHSSIPTTVKGYINESILNEVKIGQSVWVKSITLKHDGPPLEGVVESLGNRIVEYPLRIKKDPLINAWGREVVVRLKYANSSAPPLLFGEKVDIFLSPKEDPFNWPNLIAKATAGHSDKNQPPIELTSTNQSLDMKTIEASALLWNPKEEHYLLISDEQHNDQAGIFIMDKNTVVIEQLPLLDNINIDDMESISTDGSYIYASSSLSYNKKGELKPKRRKLLRFAYQGNKVSQQQEINLYNVLDALKSQQADTKVSKFLTQALDEHSLDIESHFVKDNALYLGFKAPFVDNTSTVILKLANLDGIFTGKQTSAELWQTIPLNNPNTGEPTQLSDMLLLDNSLIMLSVSRTTAKESFLWRYSLKDGTLKNLAHFPEMNAEGVTYRPDLSSLVIVFDEGKGNTSKYKTIKLESAK